eukprot:TRINITY_DN36990_c0_g1_i1.p1 TRINITY_DN36990_c0_g1~~TRINITY_DN36990_c0_g1_i1.p1  ORF type:complete len:210 (+),score=24.57 TRINITY_DN36990_c0_g1_i1:635-1264(+)
MQEEGHGDILVQRQLGNHLFGDTPLLTDPAIPTSCYSKIRSNFVDEELLATTTTSPLIALLKLNAVVGTSVHLLQEEYQMAFLVRMLTSNIVQLGPISPASTMDILCKPSPPRVLSTLRSPNPSAFSTAMCHDDENNNNADIQTAIDDDVAIYKWLIPLEKRVDLVGSDDDMSSSSWLASSWFTHDARYYKNFYMELFEVSIKLLRRAD